MITNNDPQVPSSRSVLATSAMVDLEATLSTFGSSLSPDGHTAISALLTTLEAGLSGDLAPSYYLSSIDPGTGKTLAVSKFLRAWKAAGFLPASSVLVCVSRLSEVETYLQATNALGCPEAQHGLAPVMFTTQQRIGYRARKATMAELDGFFFKGEPRTLRIWDESALLGENLTVRVDELAALMAPMRSTQPKYVDQLRGFIQSLWAAEAGSTITVPEALATTKGSSGLLRNQKDTIGILSRLAGSEVRLVDVGKGDVRLAGSAQLLPADFAPAVILDASGRVRETYKLWEERKGGLVRLPAAANDYQDLTIHLWERAAGRERIDNPVVRAEVAKVVAEAVQGRPGEEWLIVHYLGAEGLLEAIRGLVGPSLAQRVHGLTWGMHHGTNAYAHVPNIVIVGQNTYGKADYPALASAAVGGGAPELSDEEAGALHQGEHAHNLLQALCRSSVRRAANGRAGVARAYLIQSPWVGLEGLLDRCFPGHRRGEWTIESGPSLSGKAGALVQYVDSRLMADRDAVISKQEVARHLEVKAPNLAKLLARDDVVDAIDHMGVEVTARAFRLPEAQFEPWVQTSV
jgi:hypothetical protein